MFDFFFILYFTQQQILSLAIVFLLYLFHFVYLYRFSLFINFLLNSIRLRYSTIILKSEINISNIRFIYILTSFEFVSIDSVARFIFNIFPFFFFCNVWTARHFFICVFSSLIFCKSKIAVNFRHQIVQSRSWINIIPI